MFFHDIGDGFFPKLINLAATFSLGIHQFLVPRPWLVWVAPVSDLLLLPSSGGILSNWWKIIDLGELANFADLSTQESCRLGGDCRSGGIGNLVEIVCSWWNGRLIGTVLVGVVGFGERCLNTFAC